MLYNSMGSLLSSLMLKFVNKKSLYVGGTEKDTIKPILQLVSLNVNLKENLKSKALIDIGTNVNLPFNNKVIKHVQFLHPEKRP